jgi:hypothetical protein
MELVTIKNPDAEKQGVELCKNKFRFFVEAILGLENQPFHDEIDDDISQEFFSDDPSQQFFSVITMPRDHGKSKHLSIAYPLWRIAKNHNLRILAISGTAGIAESFLSEIVSNIERNDKYIAWAKAIDPTGMGVVPRLKPGRKSQEDWSGKQISIERTEVGMKDPTIAATGIFGQILSRRADIIICDDIVNQENSFTENQREKVKEWLDTTVIPVLVPGGTFIYLGNTWHQDDVVSKFMNDPRFMVQKRRGAIIKEADDQELWRKWGSIMVNVTIEPKTRRQLANAFYNENREAMDKGWETLWPDRYPYSRLYFQRLLNPYAFARMYQCDPSNRPDQVIKDEWIQHALKKGKDLRFQDLPHKRALGSMPDGNIIEVSAGGMDLAISQEESSDDTALVYLDLIRYGYDGVDDGDYLVRQIHRGHLTPNEQRQFPKRAWTEHGMQTIRVESNGYQKSLSIDLQNEGIPVRAYNTGGEKFDPEIGINSFAVMMELGKVTIPSDPSDPRTVELAAKLANEMRAFPDGHTGDSLMALWFAFSEIRELLGSRILVPTGHIDTIKDSPPVQTHEQRAPMEAAADKAQIAEQEYERSNLNAMMAGRFRR